MNENTCCAKVSSNVPTCGKPTIADNLKLASEQLSDINVAEERILSFLEERNVGQDACKPEIHCMSDQAVYIEDQAKAIASKLYHIGSVLGALQE